MSTAFADIEKLAFTLSENERAGLADSLIASLPEDFIDDEEVEEAMRRDREMDEDPSIGITLEEFDRRTREQFKLNSLPSALRTTPSTEGAL